MLMQIRDSRNNGTLITSGLKWACCYPPPPTKHMATRGQMILMPHLGITGHVVCWPIRWILGVAEHGMGNVWEYIKQDISRHCVT